MSKILNKDCVSSSINLDSENVFFSEQSNELTHISTNILTRPTKI